MGVIDTDINDCHFFQFHKNSLLPSVDPKEKSEIKAVIFKVSEPN